MGRTSGKTVRLGQSIRVHIASVSVPARQLNLTPVEPLGEARRETPKTRRKGKRKARR
jgi:hypothetical protein